MLSSTTLIRRGFGVAIEFTQIVSLIAGLVLLKFILNENKADAFNVLLFSMTIGLVIFDASFIFFNFVDFFDPGIAWLYIIATIVSIYTYLIGSLLGYSIYKLLVFKAFIVWDYKSIEHICMIVMIILVFLTCLILGSLQFYTSSFNANEHKRYTPLPVASMLFKITFSTFSLICHTLCQYHLAKEFKPNDTKVDQIKVQLESLRLYPLLLLICTVPLFITGVSNDFFVIPPCEFMNLSSRIMVDDTDVSIHAWVAFGISYVFLFVDLLLMLVVYMAANKISLVQLKGVLFCQNNGNSSSRQTIEDDSRISDVGDGESRFSEYRESTEIPKDCFSDYTIENPISHDSIAGARPSYVMNSDSSAAGGSHHDIKIGDGRKRTASIINSSGSHDGGQLELANISH